MTTLKPDKIYPLVIEAEVMEALREVYDPEIPVNIYDLGLIYDVEVDEFGFVEIDMTLTSPACPVAGTLPGEVENAVRTVPGVSDVHVELVWEPAWSMDRMSEGAKLELGFF
jgi:FeS assembly SUF system protein